MSYQSLYIHKERIYQYPKNSISTGMNFEDIINSNKRGLTSIRTGDFILPKKLERWMVEKLYDEFTKEQNSTKENLIWLLLFAVGVFENQYIIVHQVADIRGAGAKGHVTLKPYYIVPSDVDSEPTLMQELTYSNTGEKKQTRTLLQLEFDANIARSLKATSSVIDGFGEVAMLLTPTPGGKVSTVVKPIAKRTTVKATQVFFKKLPLKVAKALNNRIAKWTADIMLGISLNLAKSMSTELFLQHQQLKLRKPIGGIVVDKGKVSPLVRQSIRQTITEVISKEIVEGLMAPLRKIGFPSAKRELRKQIERVVVDSFVGSVLDVTVNVCLSIITSVPLSGDQVGYATILQKQVHQRLVADKQIVNLFRSVLENTVKKIVTGGIKL